MKNRILSALVIFTMGFVAISAPLPAETQPTYQTINSEVAHDELPNIVKNVVLPSVKVYNYAIKYTDYAEYHNSCEQDYEAYFCKH